MEPQHVRRTGLLTGTEVMVGATGMWYVWIGVEICDL